MRQCLIAFAATLVLVGCGSAYERATSRLEWLLSWGSLGDGPDFWLVKHNMFGVDEKVGVIFGFIDDREFCFEVAEMYVSRYPDANLTCYPAN